MSALPFDHNGGPPMIRGNDGWIAISRAIRTHWLVGFGQTVAPMDPSRGAFSRSEAFIDLLMECRYEAGTVSNGGRKMFLQPGQMVGAISWLASRWNWTPKSVRGWLDKLQADGMIEKSAEQNQGKQAAIITVCNYSEYQLVQEQQGQAEGTQGASKGQAEGNIYKDKQGNKGTKEKEDSLSELGSDDAVVSAGKSRNVYPDAFEQFWRQYPDTRNNSKGRAFAEWRKLSAADRAAATSALRGYARYCLENKDYRCIHAERFISHRRFDAYASQAQSPDGSAASATVWWQDPEKVSKITDAQWRGSIAKHANGVWPPDKLGPAPGSKRCVVPSHIIDELKLTERYDANGISKEPH